MEPEKPKDLLDWLGISDAPNWRVARPLGGFLAVVITLLFILALIAAFAVIFHTIRTATSGAEEGINLGAGALVAAMLGAPFVIWGTFLKYQTVRYQKEGHITDRINKAVEQLGAEKTVDRIGRPVTIWTGKAEKLTVGADLLDAYLSKPRTKVTNKEWTQRFNEHTEEVYEGYDYDFSIWPEERTVVHWQDEIVTLDDSEAIGSEGEWQVFSETVPNIEVRIGAILSLERIAQDSTRYDNGRDHVRVMEILCAYVRGNAPVNSTKPEEHETEKRSPRIDIQTLFDVLKRRTDEQITIEARQKYRLNFEGSDLRGVNLAKGRFRGAIFFNCNLQFADFIDTDLSGARLQGSSLNYVDWYNADLTGAFLDLCLLNKPTPSFGLMPRGLRLAKSTKAVSLVAAQIPALSLFGEASGLSFGTSDTQLNGRTAELRSIAMKQKNAEERGEFLPPEKGDSWQAYRFWTAEDSSDSFLEFERRKLWQYYNLSGWPFED